eukprot:5984670-Amphidinium_carterae.1
MMCGTSPICVWGTAWATSEWELNSASFTNPLLEFSLTKWPFIQACIETPHIRGNGHSVATRALRDAKASALVA